MPAESDPGERFLPGFQTECFTSFVHMAFSQPVCGKKRVNKLSGTLLTKVLSPLDQDTFTTSSNPYHIPKHYFQIPSFWGHRTGTYEFRKSMKL